MILTPLQKLPNNVGDSGNKIVATDFECLPKNKKLPYLATLVVSKEGLLFILIVLQQDREDLTEL